MFLLDMVKHNWYLYEAGLKKMLVCRHPTDPTQNLPTQKILLLCYQRIIFCSKKIKQKPKLLYKAIHVYFVHYATAY